MATLTRQQRVAVISALCEGVAILRSFRFPRQPLKIADFTHPLFEPYEGPRRALDLAAASAAFARL